MYLQNVTSKKTWSLTKVQDPEPVRDLLVRESEDKDPYQNVTDPDPDLHKKWLGSTSNLATAWVIGFGFKLSTNFERQCFRGKSSNLSLRQNINVLLTM
jgi:hypothetical protein